MGKFTHNDVLDAPLLEIKNNAERLILCNAQPADYAGVAAVALADVAIDSSDFTGPVDGDTGGRKMTVNEQADVDVDVTDAGGTNHVALVDDTGSRLLHCTTAADVAVDENGTVTIQAWDISFEDPA